LGYNDHMPTEDDYIAIAIEAGALERCPIHPSVTIDLCDPEATNRAYAIATNRWKDGTLLGERTDVTAGIKNAIDWAADECPVCAEIRDD